MIGGWRDGSRAGARRRPLAVLSAAAVLVLTGCGEDLVVTGEGPSAAAGTSSTASTTEPTIPSVSTTSSSTPPATGNSQVSADDDPEACPPFAPRDVPISVLAASGNPQPELFEDIAAVTVYGNARPDVFTEARLDGTFERPTVLAGFVGDLAAHRAALGALVAHPDRLVVCRMPRSASENRAILADVQQRLTGGPEPLFRTLGIQAGGQVVAELRADATRVAAEIHARHGDAVALTVGMFPYPMPEPLPPRPRACEVPRFEPAPELGWLDVELVLEPDTVPAGTDFGGRAEIRNNGTDSYQVTAGAPLIVVLYDPGGTEVVGTYTGPVAGTGGGPHIPPGGTGTVNLLGGTASCDPARGHALPAGRYDAVAVIAGYPTAGPEQSPPLVSTRATITLT